MCTGGDLAVATADDFHRALTLWHDNACQSSLQVTA